MLAPRLDGVPEHKGSRISFSDVHRRTNIEAEYAQKLAKLSKVPIGVEEVG